MRRCAIICSGPSLKDHDLSRIDCATLGTNLSYLTHQSDVYVFTHLELMQRYGERLVDETPDALWRFCAEVEIPGCFTPEKIAKHSVIGGRIPRLPDDYSIFKHGWIFCGSAPCALQVAVSFKFDEIIFCGLDLHADGGRHSYPPEAFAYPTGVTYAGFLMQADFFRQFKPQLDRRGIKVYNVSLGSAEDTFEKRPFDSFW